MIPVGWRNCNSILLPTAQCTPIARQSNQSTSEFSQNNTEDLIIMGTVDVLNQMADYDFNAPIKVEITFEDSDDDDDDDPTFQNGLSEREDINDNNNNKQDEITSKNHINDIGLNESMLSLNKNNPTKEISGNNLDTCTNAEIRNNINYVGHHPDQNDFNVNQHALVVSGDDTVINNEESLPSPNQTSDEPVTLFIEDVLNKLSEHLVLILQSFYHYGVKKSNEDNKKREEIFHFIKSHFFELSYTTIESIFLPQEQNASFINQFLDNTVLLANSKSLQWKCHRRHVLPFFKELLSWTKQKREHNKNNGIPYHSNENIMLKQQLIRPLLPLNFPQSEIVANSNNAIQKTHNNLCIFSSGTPGNEVSINIDADTLTQITERQKCIEQNANHNNVASNCESTRRKTPVARPTYGNRSKNTKTKNPQYDRPPPPPYNMNHNTSKNLLYRPQQNNQTYLNTNQTYFNNMRQPHHNHQNMRQPHHNHQNIGQPIPSYPTQVHYINSNHISPSDNNNANNLLYANTNNNIPMHGRQMENEVTSSPVIMNVTSLNPKAHLVNARCYMCGKTTSTPTLPYDPYNPRRPTFYCSYLCQELDSQFYKRAPWSSNT